MAFGVGLGGFIPKFTWPGHSASYLAYLALGILAYTAFMTAFFQALFAAYIRMAKGEAVLPVCGGKRQAFRGGFSKAAFFGFAFGGGSSLAVSSSNCCKASGSSSNSSITG